MKTKIPLLIAFFAFLLLSCRQVQDPEFRRIDNFRVRNVGLQHATLAFQVTYFNPNSFGVTVKEAAADVYVDSILVGRLVQDSVTMVGRNAEFSVPLSGSVALETIKKLDLPRLALSEVLVRANGTVRVGKGGVFVTRPFDYSGRHRLQIRL